MASKTEVANMAISNLGTGKEIGNIDTENSQEASACRRFFDIALEAVLRDFAWPFANVTASAGLVDTNPTTEWGFSYRYPTSCLRLIRILSGVRNDTRQSRAPLKIGKGS